MKDTASKAGIRITPVTSGSFPEAKGRADFVGCCRSASMSSTSPSRSVTTIFPSIALIPVAGLFLLLAAVLDRITLFQFGAILGLIAWWVMTLRREDADLLQARRQRNEGLMAWGTALTALAFVQILLGALVAIPVTASVLLILKRVLIPRQDAKTSPV